jgi:hypothetical protein
MTFTPQIRVRGHDESLLQNHPVFLVTHGINGRINQTLITDNDGLASFTLDTVGWNGTDISLEVSTREASFLDRKASLKENFNML